MIKSTLDLYRKLPQTLFESGEEVIKKCSGTLDVGQHAFPVFRPCNIYLTNRRLLLAQVTKVVGEFRYEEMGQLIIVKRRWLAGKLVPQLKIILKNGEIHFVVMDKSQDWLKEIAKRGKMKVGREDKEKCL